MDPNQQAHFQPNYSNPFGPTEYAKADHQQPLMNYEIPYQGDYQVQIIVPPKVALVSEKEFSCHFLSLALMLLYWLSWVLLFFYLTSGGFKHDDDGKLFWCIIVLMLVYHGESWQAGTGKFVGNDAKPIEIGQLLDTFMEMRGHVKFEMECYHYVMKESSWTYKIGQKVPKDTSGSEKKVTHTAFAYFQYQECIDNTGLVALQVNEITRLHLDKNFELADPQSQAEFERQRDLFKSENQKDEFNDYKETFEIPGFEERFLVTPVGVSVPCLMNRFCYRMFSFMGLSWFFRMWITLATDGKRLTILKKLKV